MDSKNELSSYEKEIVDKVIHDGLSIRKASELAESQESAIRIRRNAVEKVMGIEFNQIQNYSIDITSVVQKNIENMIGVVQVPLGVAGPLKINGDHAQGSFYIPLATTEGALVASVNRGTSVITESNGTNVKIFKNEMTRAPVFKFKNLYEAKDFVDWLEKASSRELMKEKIKEVTRFGELVGIEPYILGNTVYVRFSFDTKDAMGMNMVTLATESIAELISEMFDVKIISLSGNMCTDKKPAAISSINGRGKTVVSEITISRETVVRKLKCTPEEMVEVNYRKNLLGSARAGSLGFNAHAANVVAALYIACGQDPAHVVEGSYCITTMDVDSHGNLYATVTMPAVSVGTVGGGTSVETQSDCLNLLGIEGGGQIPGNNSKKLAEIVTASVLAGEISLIGAQAAGHLAKAHAALGR
ncbi:hydroxymethylglutaryl-CoA reductase (NADPH) [Methanosalsum natronophilum]|uniref:3-hydroxy-3-methylglutaryl coenzyme A reductase n=1 Tax=Methanosalsum natronophilum TaxID=768733 RepID=A0A3R8CEB3_9EURY|nr:hydroxymethylglutaryl-CoA reductase (NADPH) [Methanosalsum natronophilum]MCS3923293.1 hydroxymethylglutaryl-CoA reductase (NADPH) [Methanosalsum natronophilum]RQD92583.1 MAG: hydroxymethylglutaryl-CoA reductase (NADPH) [Methanosalsum natronophilum]